ncbi:hypothetical protein AUEXF2481DRAFT_192057 [Aureobasidium subglaciale EXF-2481]|uniref:Uncharacterized protein n=1 Tax=Aureobasidium subglaciale (strain EXF-2481) TaxID=1043005 RepID=A0A074ZMW3_AURSE|nr:uncharacterized protein AUEXF2481DRAFT_192057 [Aureobasidium subglaciale EXF-2481]KEQ99711.1 hypothetical protein AUEXF2481DRAFT_192057 [Aureobasidium subglaciale EXF-2481]
MLEGSYEVTINFGSTSVSRQAAQPLTHCQCQKPSCQFATPTRIPSFRRFRPTLHLLACIIPSSPTHPPVHHLCSKSSISKASIIAATEQKSSESCIPSKSRPPYLFLRKNHSSDSSVELCPSQLYADIHRCMKPRRQA